MRVCGLKLLRLRHLQLEQKVAPHAGVWIETKHPNTPCLRVAVAPHAGVWIETLVNQSQTDRAARSHPMRVCGLKQQMKFIRSIMYESHPMRVCGLKLH